MPYIEPLAESDGLAEAALASLADFQATPNPDHFAVWYEYHGGLNPELKRTIDILISNRRPIDDQTLDDLHRTFFTFDHEEKALQETARRLQEMMEEITRVVRDAEAGAGAFGQSLKEASGEMEGTPSDVGGLLRRLIGEVEKMSAENERVGTRLGQSRAKIDALERALEEARREATTDALTGLANRRHFDLRLHVAAGDAMNNGQPLALLMVDIDHFKRFNDSWGHQIGDSVLRLVGTTLHKTVRGGDCPARVGGEEFAVILPGTSAEAATAVGENIRRAFERAEIAIREPRQTVGRITVSVGCACYEPGESLLRLVERADAALYNSKQAGRNRVTFM